MTLFVHTLDSFVHIFRCSLSFLNEKNVFLFLRLYPPFPVGMPENEEFSHLSEAYCAIEFLCFFVHRVYGEGDSEVTAFALSDTVFEQSAPYSFATESGP